MGGAQPLRLNTRSPRASVPSLNISTIRSGMGLRSEARMKSRIDDPEQ